MVFKMVYRRTNLKIPCLKGFNLTVQSILRVYKELVRRYEKFELVTGLCNQDSVYSLN